jgi:hypothetical protein
MLWSGGRGVPSKNTVRPAPFELTMISLYQ